MGTDTAAKPRAGFLHRLQCARDGHYWERQLSDDGGQARWVCIRCGKQGETVPLVSAVTPVDEVVAAPEPMQSIEADADTGVMQPIDHDDAGEVVRDIALEPESEPEPAMSFAEPVWEPAPEPFAEAEPYPEPDREPEPEPSATSTGPSLVAVAVVSVLVVGGVYLAFRRHRRRH